MTPEEEKEAFKELVAAFGFAFINIGRSVKAGQQLTELDWDTLTNSFHDLGDKLFNYYERT